MKHLLGCPEHVVDQTLLCCWVKRRQLRSLESFPWRYCQSTHSTRQRGHSARGKRQLRRGLYSTKATFREPQCVLSPGQRPRCHGHQQESSFCELVPRSAAPGALTTSKRGGGSASALGRARCASAGSEGPAEPLVTSWCPRSPGGAARAGFGAAALNAASPLSSATAPLHVVFQRTHLSACCSQARRFLTESKLRVRDSSFL